MRIAGLEPARRAAGDFKSPVSAIPPYPQQGYYIGFRFYCQARENLIQWDAAKTKADRTNGKEHGADSKCDAGRGHTQGSVSYTHLTLPTILRV